MYDAARNVTKVTDPKAQETTYAYSALSELESVTQYLGQVVAYAYDERGRLARLTNARGNALAYTYEPWGGLQAVLHYATVADADAGTNLARTVSYAYDDSGNVTSTGDTDFHPTTPTLFTTSYDPLGRPDVVTVLYVPNKTTLTLDHGYDRFGNRSSFAFDDDGDVKSHTWTYNDLDRLASAQLAGPDPITFDYFANDYLQKITRGAGATEVTTDYTYFPEGPIETITTQSPSEQLLALTYQVDEVLNIDTLTERHGAAGPNHLYNYGYDALDRLTSAAYPTALGLPSSEAFDYDAAGNREDPVDPNLYAYDANNRIQASPAKVWVYDDDGNPASVNLGLGDEETFAYDFSNRLRTYTSAATSTTAGYLYDPFGRRIRKTVDGTTTWFVWDGDQLLAEFDGAGARQRRYTYAEGFAPVEQVGAGSPEVVSQVHSDHLDTPRVLTSSSASSVWRGAYEAFGRVEVGAGSSVSHAIRFPGQYEDGESELYYNRFRSFSPRTARYLNADPLGQDAGANVFVYSASHPVGMIDPMGLSSFSWISPSSSAHWLNWNLQPAANLAAGFGNGIVGVATFGYWKPFGAGVVDKCSSSYEWAGVAGSGLGSAIVPVGRLRYLGVVRKIPGSVGSSSWAAARRAFLSRNAAKAAGRGPLRRLLGGWHMRQWGALARIRTPSEIIAGAGRTNPLANAGLIGLPAASGASTAASFAGCECDP